MSDTCVVGSQKSSLGETFLATKTYVWLDQNIMMMSDTCVLGTRRNSLSETFFRAQNICLARLQFHVETVAHRSNYTYYSVLSINNMSI